MAGALKRSCMRSGQERRSSPAPLFQLPALPSLFSSLPFLPAHPLSLSPPLHTLSTLPPLPPFPRLPSRIRGPQLYPAPHPIPLPYLSLTLQPPPFLPLSWGSGGWDGGGVGPGVANHCFFRPLSECKESLDVG